MRMTQDQFDLSRFLTDSLSLQVNSSPTRMMCPTPPKDPYLKLLTQDPLDVLGEKSFGQPKDIPIETLGTPIQEFFRGANVFISGGTGFLGKVLTEKLIRSVPHLGHLYLLIRDKRGKTVQERFESLLEDKVFSRMKAEVPHYRSKISAVSGDLSEHGLALSAADLEMLQDTVNVVFHCAADVRFTEPLRRAITSNVLGGKRMLDLAKEMKNLKSYVHVSTAYSQCVRRVIEENVPKMSIHYKEVLEYVESRCYEELEEERIMQGWPDTYTFTKAMGESLVEEEGKGLPICIFRPSIVATTYREPVRGWTDNVYGPTGMFLATALGVLHFHKMDAELPVDIVPVDYVVNGMIAAAWKNAINRDRDTMTVYNFTITSVKTLTMRTLNVYGMKYKNFWPLQSAIWYISFIYNDSDIADELAFIFLHKIPGKIFDALALMVGQKPRLSKMYDRIKTLKKPLQYFGGRMWEFKNDNVMNLWTVLSEEDKDLFHFDVRDVDLERHFLLGKLGVRYYYMKERMETIPTAERKAKWLYLGHLSLKMVFGFAALKSLCWVAHIVPI